MQKQYKLIIKYSIRTSYEQFIFYSIQLIHKINTQKYSIKEKKRIQKKKFFFSFLLFIIVCGNLFFFFFNVS